MFLLLQITLLDKDYILIAIVIGVRVHRIHTGRSSHSWLFFISRDGWVRSNLGMGNPGIALWRWKPNVTNQILTSTEKGSSGCGNHTKKDKRSWRLTSSMMLLICIHYSSRGTNCDDKQISFLHFSWFLYITSRWASVAPLINNKCHTLLQFIAIKSYFAIHYFQLL